MLERIDTKGKLQTLFLFSLVITIFFSKYKLFPSSFKKKNNLLFYFHRRESFLCRERRSGATYCDIFFFLHDYLAQNDTLYSYQLFVVIYYHIYIYLCTLLNLLFVLFFYSNFLAEDGSIFHFPAPGAPSTMDDCPLFSNLTSPLLVYNNHIIIIIILLYIIFLFIRFAYI